MSNNKVEQKLNAVDNFCKKLTDWRINHVKHNAYHVQIQIEHNFYPSKGTYYNSESGTKMRYPKFKSSQDVLDFIAEHTSGQNKPLVERFTAEDILEVLNDVKTLEEAKKRFLRFTN